MLAKTPAPLRWLYPHRIWNLPRTGNRDIFLTFDDGPISEVTPWVLDQLKSFEASATFFCIGDNVRKNPAEFKRILEEKHVVGNHTFNHLNGWKTSTKNYIKNTLEAERLMESFGKPAGSPKIFRPPYGRASFQQAKALNQLGYSLVMWDVLSVDYDNSVSHQQCFQNVVRNVKPGSIVVFHDSLKAEGNLKYVLPKVLEHFTRKGFYFKPILPELAKQEPNSAG